MARDIISATGLHVCCPAALKNFPCQGHALTYDRHHATPHPRLQDRALARQGRHGGSVSGEQLSLGREVAIKVMDAHTGDHDFAERFLHEARLVAALNHTNLVTIYDFGQLSGGRLFLSMEYLQGGDLEERLT
ncbi:MAG: protein kinase, partial [Cellvibrionales bacterium]|nr:protein kinase [Cellvibrionales bacterium]